MEPWALSDLSVYVLASLAIVLKRHGFFQLLILLMGAVPFFAIRLPLRVFFNYYAKSYEARLPYSRHFSAFEYYCVEGSRWLLSNLNADIMGRNLFFSKKICLLMYNIRKFRYGIEEVGDSRIEDVGNDLFSGYWVKSKSRAESSRHDIVVYYSPGNMMGFTSSYAYVEYLSVMLMSLIEQGYANPAIFCIDTDWFQGYKSQQHVINMGWEHVCTQCPDSVRVMAGDGPGATALVCTMLHCVEPLKGLVAMTGNAQLRPDCAVLVSPFTKIAKMRINNENDWLTNEILSKFALKIIKPEESINMYARPGMISSSTWWEQALPKSGTYICYGQEETCANEIQELAARLTHHGKVVVHAEPDQVHAWPVVNMYVGRSKLGRTSGINHLTSQIAYMSLWQCMGCDEPQA